MTYIEYAEKLGINLNSAQIEVLNLIEEHTDESLIITLPRINGKQMLYNLIERKKGYEQGKADAIEECLQILKDNIEYIETDNEAYRTISIDAIQLLQQLKEQKND